MLNKKDFEIIEIVKENPSISLGGVFDKVLDVSYATVKRILSKLVVENFLTTTGKGKGTKYSISDSFKLFLSIDIEKYYEKEIVRVRMKKTEKLRKPGREIIFLRMNGSLLAQKKIVRLN